MKKIIFLLLVSTFSVLQSFSQSSYLISATVYDHTGVKPLTNAVVVATNINDSTLISFTRTNAEGYFELTVNQQLDYLLNIWHGGSGSQQIILLAANLQQHLNLNKILLPLKTIELNEVTVYGYADAVYFKGDTMVYTADSFKVAPNAVVEDLLKKLPGIRVDAQGKIFSQGKAVDQVLVDGDEFFGGDATIATKNLSADGVETVQVYEKKNEDASAGDQKETIQVMDLKLKDDAKKGYFGKISGASDFKQFHQADALLNIFKGSRKISLYGLGSNTPEGNFGWEDIFKYGLDEEMSTYQDEDVFYRYFNWDNANVGIPINYKAGFYYNDRWGKKTKVGLSYGFAKNKLVKEAAEFNQYFLSDTSYFNSVKDINTQIANQHRIRFSLETDLDSLTKLEYEGSIKFKDNSATVENFTAFLEQNSAINRSTQLFTSQNANTTTSNQSIGVTRKFNKKDRKLRLRYSLDYDLNSSNGLLLSKNTFTNNAAFNDSLNQRRISDGNKQVHNGAITFTEPLSKKVKVELSYDIASNNKALERTTYNFELNDYTQFDSLLSNNFKTTRTLQRAGIKFIHELKKRTFTLGFKARSVEASNLNLYTGKKITQKVNDLLPFATFRYRFNDNASINARYYTNSNLPEIAQLQPVPDISNPNFILVGNPDLLPDFKHTISIDGYAFRSLSGNNKYFNLNFDRTDRAITNNISFDSLGRSVTSYRNVNGNLTFNASMGAGFYFFGKKLMVRPNLSANIYKTINFINSKQNITNQLSPAADLYFTFDVDSLVIEAGTSQSITKARNTISNNGNTNFRTQSFYTSLKYKIKPGIEINSSVNYTNNSQRTAGFNLTYTIWNANVQKTFFKNENLIIAIGVTDILNQNINNTRNIIDNVIQDRSTNVIGRYFLAKITYKFNSSKTKEENEFF